MQCSILPSQNSKRRPSKPAPFSSSDESSSTTDEHPRLRHEGDRTRSHQPALQRGAGAQAPEVEPPRVVYSKIILSDDTSKVVCDCETYAFSNKSVYYDEGMDRGLGNVRNLVRWTFGCDAEWILTPLLGNIEFLSRFQKETKDNRVSKRRARYPLCDLTKVTSKGTSMA